MEEWGRDGPVIGIDLGTTHSCAAVWRNSKVEVIRNEQGHRFTPPYVAFRDGERLVGLGAKQSSSFIPGNTIFDAKRLIGRGWSDPCVQNDMKSWPFKLTAGKDDKPMIVVNDQGKEKRISAEEISAAVLSKMKDIAEAFLGCPVKRAVVTVPAYFNDSQRQSTKAAGTIAGLDVIRIINEPTAAALAYDLGLKESGERRLKRVLVFHLGGGTFDVSILEIKDGIVEVKVTGGDTHLGGEDFDTRMVWHFAQEFKKKHKRDIAKDARALRKLRTECERAKRNLSNSPFDRISVECLMDGIDFESMITRAKFDDLNMDLYLKCMETLEQCLKDAKMDRQSIDDVVLVGGSTRIVMIQEMLEDFFHGKVLSKNLNADEAVALGAAVQAAMLGGVKSHMFNNIVLCDVTALSLGVENYLGVMEVFIPRNTPLPAAEVQIWYLVIDYATSVTFPIYEGERTTVKDNNLLGELHLRGITPAPAGEAEIKVIFSIDHDGILNIYAEDLTSGKKAETTISNEHGRLSHEDVKRMIEDSRKFKLEDEKKKRRAEARDELESYVCTTRNTLRCGSSGSKMAVNVKERRLLEKALESAMQWSEQEDPSLNEEDYRDKKKELQDLWNSIKNYENEGIWNSLKAKLYL